MSRLNLDPILSAKAKKFVWKFQVKNFGEAKFSEILSRRNFIESGSVGLDNIRGHRSDCSSKLIRVKNERKIFPRTFKIENKAT